MSKKSNRTVTLVGVGIVVLALGIVLAAVFAPHMAGKKALRQTRRALAQSEEFSYVSILDPLDQSGVFLPTDAEARLTDAEEIAALRDRILTYMDGAKYGGVEEAVGGNWDIRVRFAGEELIDVYMHQDYFYLSQNGRRFVFIPEDAEEYTAWRAVWLESVFRAQ